jgi:hypothetical protein
MSTWKNRERCDKQRLEPDQQRVPFWTEMLQGGRGNDYSFGTGKKKPFPHVDLNDLRSLQLTVSKPTIRSSGISMYRSCPRKFMFRYRLGLRPRGYTPALRLGQAYHRIMAPLYQGKSIEIALSTVAGHMADIEQDLMELVDDAGLLPNGKPLAKQLDECYADLQKAKAMALWEWQNYPLDTDKWEVWAVERSIDLKYLTIAQVIRMRLDLVLRKKGTPELWIVDHKTSSSNPLERLDTVSFELQPRIYRLGLEALLQQQREQFKDRPNHECHTLRVVGMMHHVIQKPGIRQKQKETWEEYLARVPEWYAEKHSKASPVYVRSWLRFSGPVMPEELLMQLREASRACRADADPSRFYRDPSGHACFEYNRPCEYLRLCRAPVLDWPDLVTNHFEAITRDEEETRHG